MSNYIRGMNEDFGENTESKSERKIQSGNCPNCYSDNVMYGSSELVDEHIYYEGECEDCGTKFHEWYKLEFDGFDVLKDGDPVEYLNVGDSIINDRKTDE